MDVYKKFIQYKKIPELHYYMLIEPVKKVITLLSKNEKKEWQTDIFRDPEEIISLPSIQVNFTLAELYEQ